MQLIGWYVDGIKPDSYQSILFIIIINMFIDSFIQFPNDWYISPCYVLFGR